MQSKTISPADAPARFQTIEEIFLAAVDQEPDQISTFLDTACDGDQALRHEVEALLTSDQRAGRFIETSSVGLTTKVIQNQQADSLVGRTIGHYKISESIGTGGMGEVYLATDITAGRKAALKLLPLRFTGDAERLKRFQREARAVVGLNHPNIVTVYEIGEDHSTHYIASELIEGETLRQRLMRGQIQVGEAVDVAIQMANALVAAHETGIVHRDIKPENIMVRPDGYVKVLDFGIAKLAEQQVPLTTPRDEALSLVETNLGSILGTVRYMSPEQARGAPVDKRTDIWSLGVVLYEVVTGHVPFTGGTPKEVMSAILEKEPPPLTNYIARAPAELQQIVSKALRKDREQRYRSAHELLEALKGLRHKLEVESELQPATATPSWLNWIRSPKAVVLILLIAALTLALPFYWHRNLSTSSPPEKSIAVLPFENLTRDPDDAYLAEGIQEEILTRLAKVADLKVISRTSTQRYQSKPGNLSEIAKQLGVANILEGSVQKAAGQVRVNVQLVNAETDSHLWADSYDRKLTDIFGVESEIAKGIAESLQAKLTGREEQALAAKPTNNPEAYDAYLRGLAFEGRSSSSYGSYNPYLVGQAAGFFERAVQLDPNFAPAWARLSHMNAHLYFSGGLQSTSAQRDTAKRALDNAQKLEPNSPETLLALGYYQYYVLGDYGLAKSTFRLVNKMLPSSSELPYALGRVTRREGNWDESVTYFEQALTLEPRNVELLMELAETYSMVRQFPAALKLYDRVLDIKPDDLIVMAEKASIYQAQGNLPEAATFLSEINEQTHDELTFDTKISQLRLERNYGEAVRLLQARLAQFHFDSQDEKAVHQVALAFTQRLAGDTAGAKATAEQSRDILEGLYRDESRSPKARAHYAANLSQAYAAMGEKDSALKTAAHAIVLWPRAKDPKVGPAFEENLVLIETIFGENSRAISTLARLLETPYGDFYNGRPVTPALLRLDPVWDPLRSDPAFQKLCEENAPLPEKSIAVLPFENLSKDEENAFFAGGVQDEILTDLAKVADLKVISRTSVMKYKSDSERNLREIAKALGVSYVVEGSVQRAGERVRVSAQLIDARNDTHLWAEHYDRDFADIFVVQNEIAQQIADQLKANLSPAEKAAIAERPTADPVAYAYYTKAREIDIYSNWEGAENEKAAKQKVELLEKATQRDPNFALAYCALAKAQIDVENFELAKKAAETALRLRPDLAEGHLALARYYWLAPDSIIGVDRVAAYDRARDELAIVRRKLPNNAEALLIEAVIGRHQNRWDASLANLQRASELDPSNGEVAYRLEQIYFEMRRYSELEQFIKKQAASGGPRTAPLEDPFNWLPMTKLAQGDPVAAQSLLDQVPPEYDTSGSAIWDVRFKAALYLRDYDAANRVIAATPANSVETGSGETGSGWAYGQVARARGDKQKALAAFAAARQKMEAQQGDKPKDVDYFAGVAKLDAGLGRKEEAIREARQAVELLPFAKDSLNGPIMVANLALVYAWTGERDLALEQLEKVATLPASWHDVVTYGDLLLNPCWDSLRGDPRFDKIVAAAKAASRYALTPLSEKSIAVLPLENLSEDKENAFFAIGIQDELLSDLSKIADLKVISRTSVMQYKSGTERNLKEIAQQLGVNNVVEGSVGRAGNKVRVSVQLIDARNDTHLWAEHYDRDVADVFAIQTEIAQQIADQLQAKLSPAEKAAIAERPTADLVAYAYYTKAKEINIYDNWEGGEKSGKQKVELLEKATQRDPNFALAYCELAKAQVDVDNFELAKKAAETALQLRPDLGEAHLELARYYYHANLHTSNFDQARDELAIARRTLPNNSEAIMIGARIDKRQNRWDASLAGFQKASELDPRNSEVGWRLGQTYFQMRRYKEWEQLLMKDAGSGLLRDPWTQLLLTEIKLAQGDPVAAQSLLEQVPLDFSPTEQIWRARFMAALYLRDYDAANRVIAATPAKYADGAFRGPSHWAEGQIARARGDKQKALAAFAAAREKMEAQQGDKPKDEEYFDRVAMVDAGLGRKEDAIREARRAVELMPIAKDSQWGPPQVAYLALVYAWTGERDRALEQLEIVATIPGDAPTTYGDLRFNPCWDDLRGDPRFEKIVAAAKAASR